MLIDGGDVSAGDKVYNVLESKGIQHLDLLVMSHLHADHIGGLAKALTYASQIDKTIASADDIDTEAFKKVTHELSTNGSKITVPEVGDKYKFGSASVEVIDMPPKTADSFEKNENDSVVLMITYGQTRFLFTGDIEDDAQKRIVEKYKNEEEYKIDIIKMPHHGSNSRPMDSTGSLYSFIRTFMPDYAIISVGADNQYGHPKQTVLDLLDQADAKVLRTDENGDITVKSDGKTVSIETQK